MSIFFNKFFQTVRAFFRPFLPVIVAGVMGVSLFSHPSSALAILYSPGATLNPSCLPTDLSCGVTTSAASTPASVTQDGYVSTSSQSFAGAKTFTATTTLTDTTITGTLASSIANFVTATITNLIASVANITTATISSLTGGSATIGSITATSSIASQGTLSALATTTLNVLDMNSTKIIGLAAPVGTNDATNKAYVDAIAQGMTWQSPVISIATSTTVLSATNGFRYIINHATPAATTGCSINQVATYSTGWTCATPTAGWSMYVNSDSTSYNYNGTTWVSLGATVNHNVLVNLQGGATSEYYHLDLVDYNALHTGNAQLAALQTIGAPSFAGLTITSSSTRPDSLNVTGTSTLATTVASGLTVSGNTTLANATSTNLFASVLRAITGTINTLTGGSITATSSLSSQGTLAVTGTSTLATTTATGLTISQNGLTFASSTPASTGNTLYAQSNALYWNGTPLTSTSTSGVTNGTANGQMNFWNGLAWAPTSLLSLATSTNIFTISGTASTTALIVNGNATTTGNTILAGPLNVSGVSTLSTTTVTDLTANNLHINGLTTGSVTAGTITATSSLVAATSSLATTTISGTLAVTGNTTLGNASTSALTVSGNTVLANATSTNFFSNILTSISGFFTDLTGGSITATSSLVSQGTLAVTGTSTLATTTATGLTISQNGLTFASSTPAATSSTLYALGSSLYWGGSALQTALSGTEGQTLVFNSAGNAVATSSLFVAGSGNVGIGNTSPGMLFALGGSSVDGQAIIKPSGTQTDYTAVQHSAGTAYSAALNVITGSGDTKGGIHIGQFGSDSQNSFGIITQRTPNSAWASSPTALTNGRWLSGLAFAGQTSTSLGNGMTVGAAINGKVDGTVSSGVLPTSLVFLTSPTNASGLAERMRINANGNIGIGTTTPSSKLVVAGDSYFTATSTFASYMSVSGNSSLATTTATGLTLSQNGLTFASSTPAATSSTLYALGNTLYWNGSAVGGASATGTAGLIQFTSGSGAFTATSTFVLATSTDGVRLGVGTASPAYGLHIAGTATSSRQIGINNEQVAYLPEQTSFLGSLFFGDGGLSLSHSSGIEGQFNTGLGLGSLNANTSGSANTAAGSLALASNTSGNYNTAFGGVAMYANTTGSYNTAFGANALYAQVAGAGNTAIGNNAGYYYGTSTLSNASSSYSVFLGDTARASASGNTNEIVIGYNAVGNGSNTATFGNDNIVSTLLKGNVGIGTTTPAAKLSVAGNMFVSGTSTLATTTASTLTVTDQTTLANASSTALTVSGLTWITGTSTLATTTASFLTVSGKIGVGTTTPSSMLTIAGDSWFTATSTFMGNVGIGATNTSGAKLDITNLGTGLSFAAQGAVAFKKGNDFATTTAIANDVNFGNASLIRVNQTAGSVTITGIANGTDGQLLTLMNASSTSIVTLANATTSSLSANRIITGTGGDLTLAGDASVLMVYDASAANWRVIGGSGGSGGSQTTVTAVTTSSTQTVWGNTITSNATTASLTVTLPTAVGNAGKSTEIVKTDNTTNTVIVDAFGTQTINGSTNPIYLYSQGDSVVLRSDGTNVQIVSDNRSSVGQSKSYMRARRQISQTTGLTAGSAVVFNGVSNSYGSDIELNTTTGIFTLKAGKTYHLVGTPSWVSGTNVNSSFQWYDITNSAGYGNIVQFVSSANDVSTEVADAVITPSTDITVRLNIANTSGTTQIGDAGFGRNPYAYIEVISTPANTVNTVDYASALPTSGVITVGDIPLTTSAGNIAYSSPYYTLKAGKTYQLTASMNIRAAWASYAWVNSSNVVLTGSSMGASASVNSTDGTSITPASAIITPTVDTQLKLRLAGIGSGVSMDTSTSPVTITQIGTTGTVGLPFNYIGQALAAGSLDNTNFNQDWNWSTLTTTNGLDLAANALTTGSLLTLTSSNATLNSTNGLLYVGNTGASTNGMLASFVASTTANTGLFIRNDGNVGIGTTIPEGNLHVADSIVSGSNTHGDDTFIVERNGDNVINIISSSTNSGAVAFSDDERARGYVLYDHLGDNMQFATNGVEKIRILSNGNVGIGTTTPLAKLHLSNTGDESTTIVNNDARFWKYGVYDFGTGADNFFIEDKGATGASSNTRLVIDTNGNVGIGTTTPTSVLTLQQTADPELRIYDGSGSHGRLGVSTAGGSITIGATPGMFVMNNDRGDIGFGTNASGAPSGLRMIVASSTGNVGIGTTNPTTKLQVSGGAITMDADQRFYMGTDSTNFGQMWYEVGGLNNLVVRNGTTGGVYLNDPGATTWSVSSDARLKKNVNTLDASTLEKVLAMNPVTYNWISGSEEKQVGFIAQEINALGLTNLVALPENPDDLNGCVPGSETEKDCYGVNYDRFAPYLVKAIQEQNILVFGTSTNALSFATSIFPEGLAPALASLASSTAPTADATGSKTFVGQFFDRMIAWFGDTTNGITNFFANRIHTKEICVGDIGNETCLTKSQLDSLLSGHASATSGATSPSADTGSVDTPTSSNSSLTIVGPEVVSINLNSTWVDTFGATFINQGNMSPLMYSTTTVDTTVVGTTTIDYFATYYIDVDSVNVEQTLHTTRNVVVIDPRDVSSDVPSDLPVETPDAETATTTPEVEVATTTPEVIPTPDTTAPIITVTGASPDTVTSSTEAYIDQGATAIDDVDGVVSIVASGSVDMQTPGTYTLTYTAVDLAGNTASATRTVTVNAAPVVETPAADTSPAAGSEPADIPAAQ